MHIILYAPPMSRVLTRQRPENPFVTGGIRPYGRAQDARRRVAHLAADGYTAIEIAEIEDVRAEHVERLLGENRVHEEGRACATRQALAATEAARHARALPPHILERHHRLAGK